MTIPTTPDLRSDSTKLPAAAPLVRVTASEGSAVEKSWNLRRHVTLIGSQRRAHIVLHDPNVSRAHCVIVNTGHDVLLKDLHTSAGTWCNNRRIDLVALRNGDVIVAGATRIRVSIVTQPGSQERTGDPSAVKPMVLSKPLVLRDATRGAQWTVAQAVALIGSGVAEVRLEGADVSPAHAIVFRSDQGAAVFDLASGAGVLLDGQPVMEANVHPGQVLQIGAHELQIRDIGTPDIRPAGVGQVPGGAVARADAPVVPRQPTFSGAPSAEASPTHPSHDGAASMPVEPSTLSLHEIESDLAALQTRIAESWERLNDRDSLGAGADDAAVSPPSPSELASTAQALNERDAALRGHLHDLTRLVERLLERERELTGQSRRIHEERLKLFRDQTVWAKRKAELDRQAAELNRLEQMLADKRRGTC